MENLRLNSAIKALRVNSPPAMSYLEEVESKFIPLRIQVLAGSH